MKKIMLIFFLIADCVYGQQHPISFATKTEFAEVTRQLKSNELLNTSFENIKNEVDPYLNVDVDVPYPKDPAGGYTHDQHKFLYTLMFNAGLMYQITGNVKYADLVKNILLKYATLNPTLKNHPQATSSSPGRLFWQALNDANWLVYAGLAYDLVNDQINSDDKKTIAEKTFAPIVNYFVVDQKQWFNLIHNHAVWATAGVGIVGIACDNDNYLQMALYGTEKDGKSGYIANLDGLFSPDGYYNEGPYYTRYALLPFYLFANAINHVKPELKIFEYRNRILKKALDVALQLTNTNGEFFSFNDALKDKTYQSNEVVNAVDFAWQAYARSYDHGEDGSCPPYLRAENWQRLKQYVSRVEVRHASYRDVLLEKPDASLDRYVLLDAQDWMSEQELNLLWQEITRTATPNACVIFRTAGEESCLIGKLSADIEQHWKRDDAASAAYHAKDRSAIYGGFHLYRRVTVEG